MISHEARHADDAVGLRSRSACPLAPSPTPRNAAEAFQWEEEIGNSLVVRGKPVGCGRRHHAVELPCTRSCSRSPLRWPRGCTVVRLKPSEVAPINAFILAEVIDEVGLPAGVFNLVSGVGPVVGEAIAAHPDVDMVSFTGSTRAGKRRHGAGRRRASSGSRSSWAASRPPSCSTTPTSRRRYRAGVEGSLHELRARRQARPSPGCFVPRDKLAEVEQLRCRRRCRGLRPRRPLRGPGSCSGRSSPRSSGSGVRGYN